MTSSRALISWMLRHGGASDFFSYLCKVCMDKSEEGAYAPSAWYWFELGQHVSCLIDLFWGAWDKESQVERKAIADVLGAMKNIIADKCGDRWEKRRVQMQLWHIEKWLRR